MSFLHPPFGMPIQPWHEKFMGRKIKEKKTGQFKPRHELLSAFLSQKWIRDTLQIVFSQWRKGTSVRSGPSHSSYKYFYTYILCTIYTGKIIQVSMVRMVYTMYVFM